jgi:hypothetical protein
MTHAALTLRERLRLGCRGLLQARLAQCHGDNWWLHNLALPLPTRSRY